MTKYPNTNKRFENPKTLGEYRALAIDILKNYTDIPDRATLFVNPIGRLNVNWKSNEDFEAEAQAKLLLAEYRRVNEITELKARLEELEKLDL